MLRTESPIFSASSFWVIQGFSLITFKIMCIFSPIHWHLQCHYREHPYYPPQTNLPLFDTFFCRLYAYTDFLIHDDRQRANCQRTFPKTGVSRIIHYKSYKWYTPLPQLHSGLSSIASLTTVHWNLYNRPLESLQSSIANFTIVHKNRYPGFYIVVSCNCT